MLSGIRSLREEITNPFLQAHSPRKPESPAQPSAATAVERNAARLRKDASPGFLAGERRFRDSAQRMFCAHPNAAIKDKNPFYLHLKKLFPFFFFDFFGKIPVFL